MKRFLSPIELIEEKEGARIFIKRDDLIPFSYGGNKVLVADCLIRDAMSKGADLIVSYGAPYSNLNRAVADTAKARGLKCHVIIKDALAPGRDIPLNERLVREAGASISYTERDRVKESVERVIAKAKQKGLTPYYVYGNSLGRGNIRVLSLAYERQYGACSDFDHVFIAAGTGASISGLIAGRAKEGAGGPFIRGISIAKDSQSMMDVISLNMADLCIDSGALSRVKISDEYIEAGREMALEIRKMYKERIPLDPIYTGRAWYGMKEEIKKEGLKGNILFIHTGGYPCFLDAASSLDIDLENR